MKKTLSRTLLESFNEKKPKVMDLSSTVREELFDLNFDYISDDIQVLANLAVYVNYQMYPNSPKSFCWDLFGDGILLNIYDNSNKDFYIPLETKGGNIEYMGKQYQNKKVVVDYDNF